MVDRYDTEYIESIWLRVTLKFQQVTNYLFILIFSTLSDDGDWGLYHKSLLSHVAVVTSTDTVTWKDKVGGPHRRSARASRAESHSVLKPVSPSSHPS